jgi:hypothetical protein
MIHVEEQPHKEFHLGRCPRYIGVEKILGGNLKTTKDHNHKYSKTLK